MAWKIEIIALPTETSTERVVDGKSVTVIEKRTALENAKAAVLTNKHAIADGQHAHADPTAEAESWVHRSANDTFENLLNQLPARCTPARIELTASGALRVDQLAISVA